MTHTDDFRIMTDEDMATAKKLSRLTNERGSTPHEARLMACMRLLLAHIEGIKDGAIALVKGLDEKRDPPCNDMTDMYDEGYAQCKEDAVKVLRGEKC